MVRAKGPSSGERPPGIRGQIRVLEDRIDDLKTEVDGYAKDMAHELGRLDRFEESMRQLRHQFVLLEQRYYRAFRKG